MYGCIADKFAYLQDKFVYRGNDFFGIKRSFNSLNKHFTNENSINLHHPYGPQNSHYLLHHTQRNIPNISAHFFVTHLLD